MSAESKRARAERRQGRVPEPGEVLTPEEGESERTARMAGVWLVPGEGWCWVTADVPESLVRQYATKVGGPEIQLIALGKLFDEIESYVGKGVVR